jgi:hypothetical protein
MTSNSSLFTNPQLWVNLTSTNAQGRMVILQPRSQGLSFYHLGETLSAAGHVPPRFWEVNLIVTVRGVGKERVCSVLKLQLWVMKFIVNLQQEIVKRTFKLIFIS